MQVESCSLYSLTSKYLKSVIKLDHMEMNYPWTEQTWRESYQLENYLVFYILDSEEVVGFALFQHIPQDFGHLLKIVVMKSHQNKGIGEKLMNASINWMRKHSYNSLYLEVAEDNSKAISLYEKHGFQNIAVKKKFYHDGIHACAMQLKLD